MGLIWLMPAARVKDAQNNPLQGARRLAPRVLFSPRAADAEIPDAE
jgi:hypothetical protein